MCLLIEGLLMPRILRWFLPERGKKFGGKMVSRLRLFWWGWAGLIFYF